ncbi:MAG TPA: DUF992 domain-containing protein [Hyphomicrobiaceae bacterium]|nr:DUF992 domain-containing protein [Hyphomicrobiaceae bacterium]
MRCRHLPPLVVLLSTAAGTALGQDVSLPVGILICTLAKSGEETAVPPMQVRDAACVFYREGSGPEESYAGRVRVVSAQRDGLTGVEVLSWTVRAPAGDVAPAGALEQVYSGETKRGAASEQTISSLIGDANSSITLHAGKLRNGIGTVTILELRLKSAAA